MNEHKPEERLMGIRIPVNQGVAEGIFLMVVGGFFVWQSRNIPMGSLRAVDPGMLLRAVALMLVAGGALLSLLWFMNQSGERMPLMTFSGPILIIAALPGVQKSLK